MSSREPLANVRGKFGSMTSCQRTGVLIPWRSVAPNVCSLQEEMRMFLGWYDPDKKHPTRLKLMEAMDRYAEKFGEPAKACVTSMADAAELAADPKAPSIPVRGADYIPRYTFYVGIEDPVTLAMPVDDQEAA